MDITLRWATPVADADSRYSIWSDTDQTNNYTLVEDAILPTSPYSSPACTLASGIAKNDDTIVLVGTLTDFIKGKTVFIDSEVVVLGDKATDMFTNNQRGLNGTVQLAHLASAPVYLAHESHVVTGIVFGTRKMIRFRVYHTDGDGLVSLASQAVALGIPQPPNDSWTNVYGWMVHAGEPQAGVAISLGINEGDDYLATGASLMKTNYSTTTDADGVFVLTVPNDSVHIGGASYTLQIGSQKTYTLSSIPAVAAINYLNLTLA